MACLQLSTRSTVHRVSASVLKARWPTGLKLTPHWACVIQIEKTAKAVCVMLVSVQFEEREWVYVTVSMKLAVTLW